MWPNFLQNIQIFSQPKEERASEVRASILGFICVQHVHLKF